LQIDAEGNLGRLVKENGKLRFEVTQAQFMLTAAEREGAKAIGEVTDEYARQQNALDGLAETARGVAAAREKSVAQMKQETEASNELRDSQAALTDQALSMAETFAQSNEKMGERAGLEAQLSKLDAEIAKQGAAHVEVIKKRTMSEQELRASTSELVNLERQLWDIHRKKGETDEALNARMDATKLKYDELKIKIDQATGAVGAHTGIVGGATAAQEKERQAILDKMSAIDEEIKKELARQAVESLTPEMFGTGAAAAEKYAEAKRQLMLATGLVTSESLAEQDSIKILTAALAAGQIAPDQYATALGRVKQAAEDGKVSLGELMSSPFLAGGSKFALKNADEIGRSISAPIAAAKTQMQAAGADLASGVSAGIQSQAGAMGTALTGSVDAGVAQLKAAYVMESPSKIMAIYGADLMAGMAQGATAGAELLGAALVASVTTALVPMMETITLLSGTMNILNVSFANATLALAPVTAAITATALQADFLSLSLTNASITLSGPMSVSVVTLTGQTDLLNLSLTNVSNTLTVSLGLALATTTVALDVLNTAFTTVKNTLEFELNRVLGGPQGTIEDLITVGQLAGKSMGSIAEPLQAAFFVLRDAAAEAGSAVGGVAAGLADIKAMNGLVTHVWVYTHEVTIHEPDQTSGGGSSNPEPVSGEYQVGGIVPRTQLARVDAGEAILTPDMRRGLEPIPAGWLMPAAMERALGTAAARAAEGAAGSPGRNSGTVNHLSVYGGLALYGVQDTRSLLRELMP
jgi:hypothetical protein